NGKKMVTEKAATKNNLKIILELLSGKYVDPEVKKAIPNADKIRRARPEDLVLISFSSHGFADDDGNFYFVPYDMGQIKEGTITEELIKRCISSEELALWLRDVDAGEMVMIADACHSAATVDAQGFKPGPMGSRGLGQLAYDKRMRILTSTQADDVALESELIKQGLLTYALTHDGIEAGQADFKPKDNTITLAEWLEYGVSRVPTLYEEVKRGELQSFGRGEKRGMVVSSKKNDSTSRENNSSRKKPPYQQPSLFDFSRKKHDVALVKGI
ncbi:MAG TPA: caspase family protein, partial [Blastocatellia bacterium]|nr:caspase family protein [Blastocatellia bacterium]